MKTIFTKKDSDRAFDDWGANCGPIALAAILGLTPEQVRPHLVEFEKRHWMSPSMMKATLDSIGANWKMAPLDWPSFGLVRIQWHGPWTEPTAHHMARKRWTHWVGAARGQYSIGIFDVNCLNNGTGWTSLENWTNILVPWLTQSIRNADGQWSLTHVIEISN